METLILLPKNISIMRKRANQDIGPNEEYDIYYKNIIYPYNEDYDVYVKCKYGMNLGRLWRLNNFDNIEDSFSLTICVYAPYGELVAQKECTVNIVSPEGRKPFNILCIGDSITRGELYIEHMTHKALGATTVGTRSINYNVHHEGRGGWTYYAYYNNAKDALAGTSPFLFPKGIAAKDYYGDVAFYEEVKNSHNKYQYIGIPYYDIQDGQYCIKDGKFCKYASGTFTVVDETPTFEFSLAKYLERFNITHPDVVSLLFGANDLQMCHYDQTAKEVASYIDYTKRTVEQILSVGARAIINLPILGADQYSWGSQNGCRGTSKNYAYNIKMGVRALLEEFDGREDEGIYLCPMLAVVDPEYAFTREASLANQYTTDLIMHNNNWVHPNDVGHKQMGDALAATCVKIIEG